MIVTLTSARGGTGVTTAAVGLAAVWPRPVLLVEADPCGYSAILAGTLAASVPAGAGVLDAAMAARAGQLAQVLPGMLVALPGTNARVLPGLASVAQRRSLAPAVWLDLAAELRVWAEQNGTDVLVDTGPLPDAGHPAGWHTLADLVALVTRPDLVGVAATRNWVDELADVLADPSRLHLLVTGTHPAYTATAGRGLPAAAAARRPRRGPDHGRALLPRRPAAAPAPRVDDPLPARRRRCPAGPVPGGR